MSRKKTTNTMTTCGWTESDDRSPEVTDGSARDHGLCYWWRIGWTICYTARIVYGRHHKPHLRK